MSFDLLNFVDDPTIEKLNSCRKDDLLSIAAHFGITVQKYGVKRDIKNVIREKLMELQILTGPIDPAGSVQPVAGVSPLGISVAGPRVSSISDDEAEQQVAQATPRTEKTVCDGSSCNLASL